MDQQHDFGKPRSTPINKKTTRNGIRRLYRATGVIEHNMLWLCWHWIWFSDSESYNLQRKRKITLHIFIFFLFHPSHLAGTSNKVQPLLQQKTSTHSNRSFMADTCSSWGVFLIKGRYLTPWRGKIWNFLPQKGIMFVCFFQSFKFCDE